MAEFTILNGVKPILVVISTRAGSVSEAALGPDVVMGIQVANLIELSAWAPCLACSQGGSLFSKLE